MSETVSFREFGSQVHLSAKILGPISNDGLELLDSAEISRLKGADAAGHFLLDISLFPDELEEPFKLCFAGSSTA